MLIQAMGQDEVFGVCRSLGFDAFDGIKYVTIDDFGRAFGASRVWLVALVGGRPAGVASLLVGDDGKSVGLWNLSVHESHQGRGYGRALAEAVFAYASREGLTLNTGTYTEDGEARLRRLMEDLALRHPDVQFRSGC